MQSYIGTASAKFNKALNAVDISNVGVLALAIKNDGPSSVCAAYYRKRTGKCILSNLDTKYTAENIYDGDTLEHRPVAPGSVKITGTGVPTLIDRDADGILRIDRSVNVELATGTNGVTSAAATRTLTSAGADFITAGVVAGDKLVVQSALAGTGTAAQDKGEYTITAVATTILTISQDWPVGGHSNCLYKVISTDLDCGLVNYFSGKLNLNYPASPSAASPVYRGSILGSVIPPVALDSGDTLIVAIDGAGGTTATFTGVQADYYSSGGSFAAEAGSNMVVKVDNGTAQTLQFTASEDTIDKYVNKINSQLAGGYAESEMCALPSVMAMLNELKDDYNNHMAAMAYHDISDTNTAAGNAVDLGTAIILANSIRTNYKAHLVAISESEEAITLANALAVAYEAHRADVTNHAIADAVNVINPALMPCADYASACALAAELKTRYNAHLAQAGVHINNDAVNVVAVGSPPTTITELKNLLNDIKAKYNAHCIALTELVECINLCNEAYDDYLAHCTLAGGTGAHLIADVVNVVNPALYPATNLATAITLSDAIAVAYIAHRAQAGVHVNNDAGNNIAAAHPAATVAQLATLCNDIKAKYNAHRISTGATDEFAECATLLTEIKADYTLHIADVAYHSGADAVNTVAALPDPDTFAHACTLAGGIALAYTAHRSQLGVHPVADAGNALITTVTPTTIAQLVAMCNDIKAKYNAHLTANSELEEACAIANELVTDYEAHRILIGGGPCHTNVDTVNDLAALPAATDIATCKAILDDAYTQYEAHRVYQGGHATGPFGGCAFVTPGGIVCRITDASNPFVAADVGKHIVVANATSGGNNGDFVVTAYDAVAGSWVEYDNAAAVAEAFAAATTGTFAAVHPAADPIDVANAALFPCAATVAGVAAAANELKLRYNAHHILTLGGVHTVADPGNTIAAPDCGTADVHITDDVTNNIAAADAGTAGMHTINDTLDPITSDNAGTASIHLEAETPIATPSVGTSAIHKFDDAANDIVAVAAGDLASLQTLAAELYLKYATHIASTTYHKIADVTNVVSTSPHLLHLFSATRGKNSKIEVVSGTAALLTKLGLSVGSATGVAGSNVNNITAVTALEVKTVVELAVGAANVSVSTDNSKVRMTSNTVNVGAASIIQVSGTARAKFGFDAAAHDGADADADQYVVAEYICTPSIPYQTTARPQVINLNNDVLTVKLVSEGAYATATVSATPIE
jgi:hypothetical protein